MAWTGAVEARIISPVFHHPESDTMTDHHEAEGHNEEESAETGRDSTVDVISAVVLILLAVSGVVYFVANM